MDSCDQWRALPRAYWAVDSKRGVLNPWYQLIIIIIKLPN
jgi:hypothetical protein